MAQEVAGDPARRPRRNPRSLVGWGNPKVTGVLPVAINEATKVVQAFLHSGKEYVCLMQLHEDEPEEKVRTVLNEFVGDIYQRPPLRASVKREIRKRRIYRIDSVEMEGRRVLFRVACQAGTYVRKLVYDMGEALGCGAHMRELRRTRAGAFTEDWHLHDLYETLNAYNALRERKDEEAMRQAVRPMEEAFKHVPKIWIRDSAVDAICHGADLAVPGITRLHDGIKQKTAVAIFSQKDEVVALAQAIMSTEQIMEHEKGLTAKTVRVIMPANTYPRMWKQKKENSTLSH